MNGGEMLSNYTELQPTERIMKALSAFYELYKGDGDLVRPGAQKHGVQVIEGSIFDAPSKGNYNFRIPRVDVETATALVNSKRLKIFCEDYRQFEEAVTASESNVAEGEDGVIGVAGGAAQPEEKRLEAMAELIAASAEVNPEQNYVLGIHTGVCGGAEHFTGGEMSKILSQQGPDAEMENMVVFRTALVNKLTSLGVSPDRIAVGAAVVEGHRFVRWE